MTRNLLQCAFLAVVVIAQAARAQGSQNVDFSFLAGATSVGSQTIGGSSDSVHASTPWCLSDGFGYQVARTATTGLWLDFIGVTACSGSNTANIPHLPGSAGDNSVEFYTAGIRFMFPVLSRLSLYGALGGGGGSFSYPIITPGISPPHIQFNSSWHGVFDFGGGVDLRLNRFLSIRGEVRDFVSSSGLGGASGPHHIVPLVGIAVHFL